MPQSSKSLHTPWTEIESSVAPQRRGCQHQMQLSTKSFQRHRSRHSDSLIVVWSSRALRVGSGCAKTPMITVLHPPFRVPYQIPLNVRQISRGWKRDPSSPSRLATRRPSSRISRRAYAPHAESNGATSRSSPLQTSSRSQRHNNPPRKRMLEYITQSTNTFSLRKVAARRHTDTPTNNLPPLSDPIRDTSTTLPAPRWTWKTANLRLNTF